MEWTGCRPFSGKEGLTNLEIEGEFRAGSGCGPGPGAGSATQVCSGIATAERVRGPEQENGTFCIVGGGRRRPFEGLCELFSVD